MSIVRIFIFRSLTVNEKAVEFDLIVRLGFSICCETQDDKTEKNSWTVRE